MPLDVVDHSSTGEHVTLLDTIILILLLIPIHWPWPYNRNTLP